MHTYRTLIADYIHEQARPVDKYSHQPRLYHLARRIGAGLAYDDDILYAAAWLHDIGVFIGHRPEERMALSTWDNVAYAVEKVPLLLEQFGFPAEKIAAVVTAINEHLPTSTPTTIESALLRDADILEQLGTVGILRTVSKIGRDTRFHTFADALAALQRNLERLPDQLRLPAAQSLATERIVLLRSFIAGAAAEAGGEGL
jgi:uncharacterized protein